MIDAELQFDLIQKAGSWFKRGDTQLGQGKDAVKELLKEDNKLAKELVMEVKKKAGL